MKRKDITIEKLTRGQFLALSEAKKLTGWSEQLIRGALDRLGLPVFYLFSRYPVVPRESLEKISDSLGATLQFKEAK